MDTRLLTPISDDATSMLVLPNTLPSGGGIVQIEAEVIRYATATPSKLLGCERGFNSTTPAAHADGSVVTLVADRNPAATPIKSVSAAELEYMAAVEGDVVFNTGDDKHYLRQAGAWVEVPGTGGTPSGVDKYLGRTDVGTSLADGIETPINFTTVSNPDSLTIGQTPWSFTVGANGWVDLTACAEVDPTSPCQGYLVLWVNDSWTETMDWRAISSATRHLQGNIKVPVTTGQVLKVVVMLDGSDGNVISSADGGRVQLFYYAD